MQARTSVPFSKPQEAGLRYPRISVTQTMDAVQVHLPDGQHVSRRLKFLALVIALLLIPVQALSLGGISLLSAIVVFVLLYGLVWLWWLGQLLLASVVVNQLQSTRWARRSPSSVLFPAVFLLTMVLPGAAGLQLGLPWPYVAFSAISILAVTLSTVLRVPACRIDVRPASLVVHHSASDRMVVPLEDAPRFELVSAQRAVLTTREGSVPLQSTLRKEQVSWLNAELSRHIRQQDRILEDAGHDLSAPPRSREALQSLVDTTR